LTTQQIVDYLIRLHNGWARTGDNGVLRYLNMANAMLVSTDAEQNIVYDSDTDELPSVNTTNEVLLYTLPSTIRRIVAVLIKAEEYTYNPGVASDYGRKVRTSSPNLYVFGGVSYIRIPFVKTRDRTNKNTLAQIRFTVNPGTKDGYYYYASYKTPTDIISETIQHDIPEPYDIQFLLPAASLLIAGVQNYTFLEAVEQIRLSTIKEYANVIGQGDQGYLDSEPVDRGF
jgi:hypothetical protein